MTVLCSVSWAGECQNGQTTHPEWVFCDDFEDTSTLVRQGRYFEYDNNNNDFIVTDGVGFLGSRAMRALWQKGEISAGGMSLGFGRNPSTYMNKGIRANEDFREIYYRMYLKMESGWQGSPAKLSRATVVTDSSWSQAMIAHIWSDSQSHLLMDPASCVDANSTLTCNGYNDFPHITWLGAKAGTTTVFDTQHSDKWLCVEAHVKLNDQAMSNGIQEFWIDGQLEARRNDLNFVGSYNSYGINAIFFENYWNSGSPRQQARFFDNIVVSTQRIGCINNSALLPPQNLRIAP